LEWEHSCLGKGCRNEEERQALIIEHRGIQNSNKFIIICVRAMLVLTQVMKIVMNQWLCLWSIEWLQTIPKTSKS
jgi:hypothetical protein